MTSSERASVSELADALWKSGHHRFRLLRSSQRSSGRKYIYVCCQDSAHAPEVVSDGLRDRMRMERFSCGGKLTFLADLEGRRLKISIHHEYHAPYTSVHMSDEATAFITSRCLRLAPGEIYRELRASDVSGVQDIAQHQVYYLWQKANSSVWRRDPDQLRSAQITLEECSSRFQTIILSAGNVRGLALYIRDSMSALSSLAKELAIDATYGTNHTGLELFAVLSEVDGTGVPLAYLFVGPDSSTPSDERSSAGAKTTVLAMFLAGLKDAGFNPEFFGCDKDQAEINAITETWPATRIQLCFWHAKRSIRKKLQDSTKTRTQNNYHPAEALQLIPTLEVCWGSQLTRRPPGDHRYGRCQCQSRSQKFSEQGRLETVSVEARNAVLHMFSRHYNMHPFIPDSNGTYRSSAQIHIDCTNEAYAWCFSRGYFRLWAYFFVNWYCPAQWKLWARAANESSIPVLKTTMIMESHWRRIKHDFLHRFNRPRVDLVVWVLTSRVVPTAIDRMNAILRRDRRAAIAPWRKAFKQEWRELIGRHVDSDSLQQNHTNASRWVCACSTFLLSRFLLCEHVLHCFESIPRSFAFFATIQKRRQSPFWVQDQLVLRAEFQPSSHVLPMVHPDQDAVEDSEFSEVSEFVEQDPTGLSDDDHQPAIRTSEFLSKMRDFMQIMEEQESKGNTKFIEACMPGNASNLRLVEEIQQQNRQRTMPRTWTRRRHPATMYYN